MKHVKRFIVAALAVVTAVALCVPALAFAADDASITITPKEGATGTNTATYNYYELLHASISGTGDNMKVSYYLLDGTDDTLRGLLDAVKVNNSDLFTFTKTADGSRWIATINKKADNTEYTDSDGADIATALNTNAIKEAALATGNFSMANGTAKAQGLEKGYYLVTSTLGSNLVLQTLGNVTIQTKNEQYTSAKTANKTDMNIGDLVTYTVTVNVPSTANVGDEVTVHDTIDSHLAIKTSTIAATFNGDPVTLSDGTKKTASETFAKKFTVTSAMLGESVIVTYQAELLSTAAADAGYVNSAFVSTPSYESVTTSYRVYTFDFNLTKSFEGSTANTLQATFKLYPDANGAPGTTAYQFVTTSSGGYIVADSDDSNKTDTITAKNGTKLNVNGLAAGTYYLVEQGTEDGYNLLAEPVKVVIADTSTASAVSHSVTVGSNTGDISVENKAGSVLPSTGGIGTTVFYVVGAILVIGAIVVLIAKHRARKEDDQL